MPNSFIAHIHAQAEAVLLDLVKPLRPGGNLDASGRDTELKRLKHGL